MNRLIRKQLDKLRVAKIDSYDELKHIYTFKKHKAKEFKIDSVYVLRLSNSLMIPKNNEILISNWNKGNHPLHQYMKVQVDKKLGNMLFVCGAYYDINTKNVLNEYWSGWLPDEELEIIEEVK